MRIEITFGVGVDANGGNIPVMRSEHVASTILADASMEFGGVTAEQGFGAWREPNGKLVTEPTVRLIIHSDDPNAERKANDLADYIRHTLNQSSVLVSIDRHSEHQFIGSRHNGKAIARKGGLIVVDAGN